jgi:hypothetical protein
MPAENKTVSNYSKHLGMYSGLLAGLLTILFGIFVVLNNQMVYFTTVLFLPMVVVMMTISLKSFIIPEKKVLVECAVAFGVMYALLVSMVYYTQIAVVLKGTLNTNLLPIVSDFPGTVFFFLDMFGYCLLCLSTLFMAFAIGSGNRSLRAFLFIHSALFIPTFLLPFLPITFSASSDISGSLILVLWCIIFAPVCLLLARFFAKQKTKTEP